MPTIGRILKTSDHEDIVQAVILDDMHLPPHRWIGSSEPTVAVRSIEVVDTIYDPEVLLLHTSGGKVLGLKFLDAETAVEFRESIESAMWRLNG